VIVLLNRQILESAKAKALIGRISRLPLVRIPEWEAAEHHG
jgi:hypothetical protein